MIRNSDHLSGFTDHEIELIALVARYHRKSAPSAKHAEFAALRPTTRTRCGRWPASSGWPSASTAPTPGWSPSVRTPPPGQGRSSSRPSARPGADLGLELYTADERKGLLEEVLGRPVRIEAAGSGPGAEAGRGGAAVASDPLDQPA